MNNAGGFAIEVSGPYPAWCRISYQGQHVKTIHHKELSDLKYVVEKAMQEARILLKDDAGEV